MVESSTKKLSTLVLITLVVNYFKFNGAEKSGIIICFLFVTFLLSYLRMLGSYQRKAYLAFPELKERLINRGKELQIKTNEIQSLKQLLANHNRVVAKLNEANAKVKEYFTSVKNLQAKCEIETSSFESMKAKADNLIDERSKHLAKVEEQKQIIEQQKQMISELSKWKQERISKVRSLAASSKQKELA